MVEQKAGSATSIVEICSALEAKVDLFDAQGSDYTTFLLSQALENVKNGKSEAKDEQNNDKGKEAVDFFKSEQFDQLVEWLKTFRQIKKAAGVDVKLEDLMRSQ